MDELRLEWNRPRVLSADIRGAYTKAIRDESRQLHLWIWWASNCLDAVRAALIRHNRDRGAFFLIASSIHETVTPRRREAEGEGCGVGRSERQGRGVQRASRMDSWTAAPYVLCEHCQRETLVEGDARDLVVGRELGCCHCGAVLRIERVRDTRDTRCAVVRYPEGTDDFDDVTPIDHQITTVKP